MQLAEAHASVAAIESHETTMSEALKEAEDRHAHQLEEAYLVTRAKHRTLAAKRQDPLIMAEPPNLMPPRCTCLPLGTKYSREDTKLRSSIEHTPRKNPKIHIFPSGSQMKE